MRLEKRGYSYNDILKEVAVAKSTLSGWLKGLPLTKEEKNYLKKRVNKNISRGRIKAAAANRKNRLIREKQYVDEAREEFYRKKNNPLFLIGLSLYWAEGAKRSSSLQFMNSDPEMIKVFVNWLEQIEGLDRQNLYYRLFIHKPYAHENCEEFWADYLKVPVEKFKKTVYKPTGLLIKKRPDYKGCFRVSVPCGTKLLFKIKVWQNMLVSYYS